MPPRSETPELLRMVVGTRGQVRMNLELVIRFDYGSMVPWVRRTDHGISAIAGPDMLGLRHGIRPSWRKPQNGCDFYRERRRENTV